MRPSTVIIAVALSAFATNAKSQEMLTLELLCTGDALPQFASQEDRERFYFRQQEPSTRMSTDIEYRVSIKDNTWDEFPLKVSDKKIEPAKETVAAMSDIGLEVSGSIDRLTGKFVLSVKAKSGAAKQFFDNSSADEEMPGLSGVEFAGECEKLDPAKKKF